MFVEYNFQRLLNKFNKSSLRIQSSTPVTKLKKSNKKKEFLKSVPISKLLGRMSQQDRDQVLKEYETKWETEQFELKKKLIVQDDFDFLLPCEMKNDNENENKNENENNKDIKNDNNNNNNDKKENEMNINKDEKNIKVKKPLKYIAGVDISHGSKDEDLACAGLVILEYPSLKQVYSKYNIVRYTQPYIAGFLAFREVDFLIDIINEIKLKKAEYIPQIILVDGNGILHHRGFGLASHLGVLTNIPTIGIGKNLLHIDNMQWKGQYKEECLKQCKKKGDFVNLIGESKKIHGMALRCGDKGHNVIFVSIGHKICLQSCKEIVLACSIHKIPEPIRAADLNTRDEIRKYEAN